MIWQLEPNLISKNVDILYFHPKFPQFLKFHLRCNVRNWGDEPKIPLKIFFSQYSHQKCHRRRATDSYVLPLFVCLFDLHRLFWMHFLMKQTSAHEDTLKLKIIFIVSDAELVRSLASVCGLGAVHMRWYLINIYFYFSNSPSHICFRISQMFFSFTLMFPAPQ
jgi:hypothetical protein